MKFYGKVGHNALTNWLDFELPQDVKRSQSFLQITPFKIIVVWIHDKIKSNLFSFLNNYKYYYGRSIDSLKAIDRGQRSEGQVTVK